MGRKLNWDANNIEIILEETANKHEYRYIYALAVAVFHILEWIHRKEGNANGRH